jgi:SAM-dependent methyltransferase
MPNFLIVWLSAWAVLTAIPPSLAAAPGTNSSPAISSIPYVPTRHDTVKDLLWLAEVGTNDVVYDLGSGDGRVVIAAVRDFGARRAVGIEINPQLVQESREKAVQAGVVDRAQFIEGDLFTNDVSPASVVVLYLGHGANIDLRAQLVHSLKPGARVVSHQFSMGEWTADKLLDVRTILLGMYGEMFNEFRANPDVPDYDNTGSRASHDVLSAWIVPAPVAGTWRGKVRLESEERELRLTLDQRLSGVTGSFAFEGPTNLQGQVEADLWGDHLRCWCMPTNQACYWSQMWFEGRVKDETLNGSLWVPQGQATRECKWVGRRDQADLTGTWEWLGPKNSPVQLKIERRHGRLTATYVDKSRATRYDPKEGQPIPVTDFYDFGGGFYFTLLLGLEGNRITGGARRAGPEDGWLVGEAVAQEGTLQGTIAFYPYALGFTPPTHLLQPGQTPVAQPGRHNWQPKRVGP